MLKWRSAKPPLPESVVRGAELILGYVLPSSYRSLVQQWPSGHPDRSDFPVQGGGRRGSWISCVGVLLSLDPRHTDNVFECLKNLAIDDQLPDGLLPVSDDGGGDLICLDYRHNSSAPEVVYWAHELSGEEAVVPIAPSFDAFLELLEREGIDPDLVDEHDG